MQATNYNPDVLTCLANLSNDEVFTPPALVNQMLDILPVELWSDKEVKFFDPVSKSGVFLREIAKRLMLGLKEQIPDQQERINHIFKNQLFGIAITELTSLLSHRTVYCSKTANGKYSVCDSFDNEQGNIIFDRIEHKWQNGKCSYCGASQEVYDRGDTFETYAYQFIHTEKPENIFNMKFDVIVGNPPYQLNDGGDKDSDIKSRGGATPLYHKFIEQSKKLNPRFLLMIIPSRWFAGGRGLDEFRSDMLNDRRISKLVDFPIASDVFPGIKLIGGACYFLWERDFNGKCKVVTNLNGERDEMIRDLNEHETFVRFNKAIPILKKITDKPYIALSTVVSKQKPFGLRTYERPTLEGEVTLFANKEVGKIPLNRISIGLEWLNMWKIFTSMGYGEGGESRPYPRMITGKPIVAPPMSACTETYIVVGKLKTELEANNLAFYLSTKFIRFLIGLKKNTQHITSDRFEFVPIQNFDESWTDEKLYQKYGLTAEEIEFIESMIRPMERNNEQ